MTIRDAAREIRRRLRLPHERLSALLRRALAQIVAPRRKKVEGYERGHEERLQPIQRPQILGFGARSASRSASMRKSAAAALA
jgi:hypothetical protein